MAYFSNPFLERRSERATSDAEFVELFSPKLLERLPRTVLKAGVHVFHSPPGAGKTTLLRAFTPAVLKGFWGQRKGDDEARETFEWLSEADILSDEGTKCLGVMLSCAAGYADLPPGADLSKQGLFRALFDCRTVLKAIRGVAQLVGDEDGSKLAEIELRYAAAAPPLRSIPLLDGAEALLKWAEQTERRLYLRFDGLSTDDASDIPAHVRFESLLWLEAVRFLHHGKEVAPTRLLMVDDLHKLRDSQRDFFLEELTTLRSTTPIWLAGRSIALGKKLISQGGRYGRDLSVHALDELWTTERGTPQFSAFSAFAENILDRRLSQQSSIRVRKIRSIIRDDLDDDAIRTELAQGIKAFEAFAAPLRKDPQYAAWLERADFLCRNVSRETVTELFVIRILMVRNQRRPQLRLDLSPLPAEEIDERDGGKDERAAEIFMREELRVPYYYGFERIAALATFNVEEMLQLAAHLYEGLRSKQALRHRDPSLAPSEQERILSEAAKKRFEFIPRTHTQGTRARKLLSAIGQFCREKTFQPNAPYAPGVTGVALTERDLALLESENSPFSKDGVVLTNVLHECVAENLLVPKPTAATTGRDAGTIYYLNRTLCVYFGLPIQHGGWQALQIQDLIVWMQRGPSTTSRNLLVAD